MIARFFQISPHMYKHKIEVQILDKYNMSRDKYDMSHDMSHLSRN